VREQPAVNDDLDFSLFKRKVRLSYGIDLNAYKRQQMERRLRANMLRCGAHSFQQYYAAMQTNAALLDEFLDRITINVSELFRNPEQFETLRTVILPKLLEGGSALSVWSAGCSYGAEPYSLAILLDELAPGRAHKILATDIDERMLARARAGEFADAEMRNVSRARLLKYFDRRDDKVTARSTIKNMISFARHNLLEDSFGKGFDLIVCRNVVIYFTDETKKTLYSRFFGALRPGGYLFVGGTERIADHADLGYETHVPFFYGKPRES